MRTHAVDRIAAVPARAGGAVLATAVRALAWVRPAPKPLHPKGEYARGSLTRFGTDDSGVPWLDTAGTDEVVVRMSRGVGLPRHWPDVRGIALRVRLDDGDADLLFATTGWGRFTRFLLTVARAADRRPYSTLLPYRSPTGPVVLGLWPEGKRSFRLERAHGMGTWAAVGHLVLDRPYAGPALAFDPVAAPVPGLPAYAWVAAVRRPSYRAAQRGREAVGPEPAAGPSNSKGEPMAAERTP